MGLWGDVIVLWEEKGVEEGGGGVGWSGERERESERIECREKRESQGRYQPHLRLVHPTKISFFQ